MTGWWWEGRQLCIAACTTRGPLAREETMDDPVTLFITASFALDSTNLFEANVKYSHGKNELPQIYDFNS